MKQIFSTILILLLAGAVIDAAPRRPKKKAKTKARTTQVVTAKPRTSGRFVTRLDEPEFKAGLDGRNIALWASHGRFYDQAEERWCWQRGRLLGTVEDLYTVSYVYPFLAPMLENAGAYVMMPRERDLSTTEIIVDNDGGLAQSGYKETNGSKQWKASERKSGFAYRQQTINGTVNPFRQGSVREIATVKEDGKPSKAVWNADVPERGEYAVYVSYASLPESATDVVYRVNSMRGTEEFKVNQTMGGSTWVYLGTFPLEKGDQPVVELSNVSSEDGKVVTADAVKIGGGMGNVVRGRGEQAGPSGYPRFTEGARYWLQWAGMPESVYSISEGANDYEDDYKSRGLWVNYLSGGSKSIPGKDGLGIPIDLSFALHTDAGMTQDAMTSIGTLPIVSTAGGTLGDGRSRDTSVKLGTMVTDQIIDDIWQLYDPNWTRRKLRNKSYHEAREPMVPAMLLELLSHQNFADMRLGLDPGFRFDVSRSIYKGILKYLHTTAGTPYVVQPLPVGDFEITGSEGDYTLRWSPTPDPLEPSATPKYYIVYERIDDGAFAEFAITDEASLSVAPEDDRIYSYKVVAANDGGVSFPSEILSLCYKPGMAQVTIVNGFTRVSGPAEVFDSNKVGFDYLHDFGVPYQKDVLFTGAQTEFRPGQEWLSNDAPGHGASRATHETVVIAGNTFDYPYIHGVAIREAGYSFISSGVDAFIKSSESPAVVDLILGQQKEIKTANMAETRFKPFTQELKDRLSDLCNRGTALMVSGSYVGSDLYDNPHRSLSETMSDRQFAHDILGIEWRQSQATVTGEVREVKTNMRQFDKTMSLSFNQALSGESYAVQSPESFIPAKGYKGAAVLRYTENDYPTGCAVILTGHKVFAMGFPFEAIKGVKDRAALMAQILNFLTAPRSGLAELIDLRIPFGTIMRPASVGSMTNDDETYSSGMMAYLREDVAERRTKKRKQS